MNLTTRLSGPLKSAIIIGILFGASQAQAFLLSSVDANIGFSSYRLELPTITKDLQSPTSIEVNYNQSSTGLAYNFSIFEMYSSNEGTLAYSRFSVGLRYFPMGMNGARVIIDNTVQATVWKATPFIGFNFGIANASVKEFNASIIELAPRFGVEIPVTIDVLMQAQLLLVTGASTGGSSATEIKLSGVTGLIGFIFTNL